MVVAHDSLSFSDAPELNAIARSGFLNALSSATKSWYSLEDKVRSAQVVAGSE